MTDQLPRPIGPGEIRVGDRVRVAWFDGSTGYTAEFDVADRCVNSIRSDKDTWTTIDNTWTLLARPTPAPAVGSRWRADDGSEWVIFADHGVLLGFCYLSGRTYTADRGSLPLDSYALSNATPIPDHDTGCSPWLWDKETDTAWVESDLTRDPGGMLITHVQVHGERTNGLTLTASFESDREIAARLVPWSERGQANG